MIRILVGTCARQVPEVLAAHLKSILWQSAPNTQIDLCYVDDSEPEHAEANRLHFHGANARILEPPDRPDGAAYRVTDGTHEWAIPTFHHLARAKQLLFDLALAERYDFVWLVDSDLLCAPDTLRSLLACNKEIVSAVFWTRWTPNQPPMPQVWVQHPYGFEGGGWTQSDFLSRLQERELVRVRGLGACTLISRSALEAGAAFWPLLPGLPSDGMWQGEDRHFCVRAERLHLPMFADAWPHVWHCYRPADRARIPGVLEHLSMPAPAKRKDGDWISCTIFPCEEPGLALHQEHIRGRLGMLKVLPEIDVALRSLPLGDSCLVRADHPASHPIPEYRGQSKTYQVRLHSVRAP